MTLPPREAGSKPVVLLVEDDVRTARLLAKLLREDGWDVDTVFDGAAAIQRLTGDRLPDALIVDVRLPHADGIAVAKFARSHDAEVPVVFVTAYSETVDASAFEPKPLVLGKPVSYPDLMAALHSRAGGNTRVKKGSST